MEINKKEMVEFKGTGKGLVLYINAETPMETIFDVISSKVQSFPNFFEGGLLTEIESNYISPYQKKLIVDFLAENYNIKYMGVDDFSFNELMKQKEYKGAAAIYKTVRTLYVMSVDEGEVIDYNGTVVVLDRVPKDSTIKASCDIIVLSYTEADSALIAGGNITVMDEIRGLAYAGAYGNDSACIIAKKIDSPRIGIYDCMSENVVSQRKTNMSNPEIAYINEKKEIVVSQKREVLYRFSPDSIKDTSHGAFDIEEYGRMLEKYEIPDENNDDVYDEYDSQEYSEYVDDEEEEKTDEFTSFKERIANRINFKKNRDDDYEPDEDEVHDDMDSEEDHIEDGEDESFIDRIENRISSGYFKRKKDDDEVDVEEFEAHEEEPEEEDSGSEELYDDYDIQKKLKDDRSDGKEKKTNTKILKKLKDIFIEEEDDDEKNRL